MSDRILRDSIKTSESLAALSADAERLFYRLLTEADGMGRFHADARVVSSSCFPLMIDQYPAARVEALLAELTAQNLIAIYAQGGRRYGEFVTFAKHNRFKAKSSKLPSVEDSQPVILALSHDETCEDVSRRVQASEDVSTHDETCEDVASHDETSMLNRVRIEFKKNRIKASGSTAEAADKPPSKNKLAVLRAQQFYDSYVAALGYPPSQWSWNGNALTVCKKLLSSVPDDQEFSDHLARYLADEKHLAKGCGIGLFPSAIDEYRARDQGFAPPGFDNKPKRPPPKPFVLLNDMEGV